MPLLTKTGRDPWVPACFLPFSARRTACSAADRPAHRRCLLSHRWSDEGAALSKGLFPIDNRINGLFVLRCHFPKRIFDDARRIPAHAQLKEQHPEPLMAAQEVGVALCSSVPAPHLRQTCCLCAGSWSWAAADRTVRHQFSRHPHVRCMATMRRTISSLS